jgi:hypothetical protein
MGLKQIALLLSLPLLDACNMVVSEKPMFAELDRSTVAPRDGIWLGENEECQFDASKPESGWPGCAMWVVVRNEGRELNIMDGKKESQRVTAMFAAGTPMIIEAQWIDDAKEPAKATYGYYGIEPRPAGQDGRFIGATLWPVDCGVKSPTTSEIRPFPGITPECRPTSKDAIRAAAVSSRRADQVREWQWLRAERR